ncbi:MAG: hypothetical protein LWW85_13150 [Marinilabiliales bacterium]|nr:hypothetical protein [Marinilabiliales bacterium]
MKNEGLNLLNTGRERYSAPEVECIEIKIEKGFAATAAGAGSGADGWGAGGTW